jgi:hypothetical protein
MTTFASPTFTADYQALCNTIADTLNRMDLTASIPNFVALASSRISRDMARIKHPSSIARAQASVTADYAALPADYISMYRLMDQDTSMWLEYITPDQIKQVTAAGWDTAISTFPPYYPYQAQGTAPIYFSIIGNTLNIIPTPGSSVPTTLDLWYYADVPALNATTTTNWVLTNYPDLYFYGALSHSAPYLKADDRIPTWEGIYQKLMADIEVEADRATRPQSKLVSARKSF